MRFEIRGIFARDGGTYGVLWRAWRPLRGHTKHHNSVGLLLTGCVRKVVTSASGFWCSTKHDWVACAESDRQRLMGAPRTNVNAEAWEDNCQALPVCLRPEADQYRWWTLLARYVLGICYFVYLKRADIARLRSVKTDVWE